MNSIHIQDELLQFVRGEIEWLTYLGQSFESAVSTTRRAVIDAVDVSLIITGLMRDFERNGTEQESAT